MMGADLSMTGLRDCGMVMPVNAGFVNGNGARGVDTAVPDPLDTVQDRLRG
jgi:hypothetical protein